MDSEYRAYLERRAREERERAAKMPPTDPAAIAHRKLAEEYERRIALGLDSDDAPRYSRIAEPPAG